MAIVVGTDSNLTKAHIRYIESRLIGLARSAGRVALANGTEPEPQRLPEADTADMTYFISQICLVLPTLGYDLFRPETRARPDPIIESDDGVFTFATAGAAATARETDDGFVIKAGSTARAQTTETFQVGYRSLREQLMADGLLVPGPSSDLLRFTADVSFASPSAAAAIVAGRSASGPREWKLKSSGLSYGDWRAERLEG